MPRKDAEQNISQHGGDFNSAILKDTPTYADPVSPELFSDPMVTAAWFGGVLEAGAMAGIGVAQYTDKYGILRRKTQPSIKLHSTSEQMLNRLYATYGGM